MKVSKTINICVQCQFMIKISYTFLVTIVLLKKFVFCRHKFEFKLFV